MLGLFYELNDPQAVSEFLAAHSHLFAPLLAAHKELHKYFGQEVSACLELVTDPDSSALQQLTVWIRSSDVPEVAVEKRRQFASDWWLQQPYAVRRYLSFVVESK